MSKPQEVWKSYKSLLKSKHFDEWGALWADDGRFVVEYGKERFGEETYTGRENIVSFFSGSREKIEIDFENDVVQETEKQDIFFVTFDFNAIITTSGYQYKNRIVCQFTLDEQAKIKELIEYADPIARQGFLKQLGGYPMSTDVKLKVYEQLCNSYHAIDDFRAKLLGFLPLATGAGILLLLDKLKEVKDISTETKSFLVAGGVFGFLITLGLFFYEVYGIKKCHALIQAGQRMEDALEFDGQFKQRPQNVLYLINEPFAAGVIYPAVLAAWMFLAVDFAWSQAAALVAAPLVFIIGVACTIIYDLRLRKDVMEVVLDDIKVLYVESAKGPEGSPEVYTKLKSRLPSSRGRELYGIFQHPDGPYRAFVSIIDTDDLKTLGLESWIIPHGKYARRKLKNWTKRTWEIPETFATVSKEYKDKVDSSRPRIEFYKSEKELLLFLPIK